MFEQEIEWNINQGAGILILKRMDEVDESSKLGDKEWFEALRRLFRKIEHIKKIDHGQMEEIDKLMMAAADKLDQPEPISESSKAVHKTVLKNIKRDLDRIDRLLNKAINDADLIKFHINKDPKKSILK